MNTWISIVPPALTIILAVTTRQVYVSLLIGLITGASILSGGFLSGLTGGLDAIAGAFGSVYIVKNILFLLLTCCLISFSTGSTGATLGIMMPIAVSMMAAAGLPIPIAVGAVISGALFGDQSSPISDSVIVASMAAGCEPIDHYRTQIRYTLIVSTIALILYLIVGSMM